MKTNEHDFYSEIANWSFEDIDYTSEVITNWIYEDEIKNRVKENTKILDLGTAAGEKVLKNFPNCAEILGTDFTDEMIETANKFLLAVSIISSVKSVPNISAQFGKFLSTFSPAAVPKSKKIGRAHV